MRLRLGSATALLGIATAAAAQEPPAYTPAPGGTTQITSRSGLAMRVLVDSAVLGGAELAMVEITLPAGRPLTAGEHRHGSIEVFYVLEGELEHVVDGVPHRLGAGSVGIVRPGDPVRHRVVSADPVRALLVWVPAGELERVRPAMAARELAVARSTASDAAGLTRLRRSWSEAYQAGDAAAIEELYTADVVRMPYDAPAQVGRHAVMQGYISSFARRSLTPEIELTADEVHITPTLAVERGSYHEILRSADGVVRIIEDGTYVSLIRRDSDGTWRYEWSIFNRDAAPSSPSAAPGASSGR